MHGVSLAWSGCLHAWWEAIQGSAGPPSSAGRELSPKESSELIVKHRQGRSPT